MMKMQGCGYNPIRNSDVVVGVKLHPDFYGPFCRECRMVSNTAKSMFRAGDNWYAINHIVSVERESEEYGTSSVVSFSNGQKIKVPGNPKEFLESIGIY